MASPAPLDELDRRIVAALQLDSRAAWAQLARLVGSTETTVARRAQRLIDDEVVRVIGVADPIRCGFGYPVLVQLRCEPGTSRRVAEALAARDDVRFLALATGRWDLLVELIVSSRRRLAGVLVDDIGHLDGVAETTTALVTRNFKMTYDWSRTLLGEAIADNPVSYHGSDPPQAATRLDDSDRRLLAAVTGNARKSVAELAVELGISDSSTRRRLDRLVDSGCLTFSTLVNPPMLGFDVELFVWLRVQLDRLDEVAAALGKHPEIRYLSATAGFADLVCEVVLRGQGEVYPFTTEVLGGLPGVRDVEIGIELESRKRAYRPPAAEVRPTGAVDLLDEAKD